MSSISSTTSVNKKKLSQRLAKENNKYKEYPLLNLYILISIALQLIGELVDYFPLRLIKPLPIVLMIIYISGKNSQRDHLVPTLVKGGLALSLIGDVLLMVDEISAFMIGTGFFLIAHLLYCLAFYMGDQVRESSLANRLARNGVSVVLIIMFVTNVHSLWDKFPNRILFVSYCFVLLLMNILSINRYNKTTPYSYWFMAVGAVSFGISDNILGFLKFNGISSHLGRALVMLFYYAAQFLLMHGAMHHSNLQYQISRYQKLTGATGSLRVETVGKKGRQENTRWEGGSDEQHND